MRELLARLEQYYDAVPRRFARVEEHGPFTLFLGTPDGWTYYARPRLGGHVAFDAAAVASALARLRAMGLPEVVEWIHETTPTLRAAVRDEGSLDVEEIPLMVLSEHVRSASPLPPGLTVRLLGPDDEAAIAASRAVADVGFAAAGTAVGPAGPRERDAARKPAEQQALRLLAEGSLLVAVAESPDHGVVATGRALPVAGVAEIVGVATLPSMRRQGLAAAVTSALVEAARAQEVDTVFLTAGSEAVARVYERVGFHRIGTGYAAERPRLAAPAPSAG